MLELNKKYILKFKPPFNTPKLEGKMLTVSSIRTYNEFFEEDISIFDAVYNVHGLTMEDFTKDVASGASIYTLVTDQLDYVYVPTCYVESNMDIEDTHIYTQRIIGFNLGLLPDDLNLSVLYQEMSDVVEKYTGLIPVYNEIQTGESIIVSEEEDSVIRKGIEDKLREGESYKELYYKLLEEHNKQAELLKALETFLIENKISGTSNLEK